MVAFSPQCHKAASTSCRIYTRQVCNIVHRLHLLKRDLSSQDPHRIHHSGEVAISSLSGPQERTTYPRVLILAFLDQH